MSKYDTLSDFLKARGRDVLPLSFAEVEKALGFKLPASAFHHPAWWANEYTSHVQAKAWRNAGYQTEQVDMAAHRLVFRRVARSEMKEDTRMFQPANDGKATGPHPAFGALKGSFTIVAGWDLTKPALDEEELGQLDAAADATADLIEKGLTDATQ